MFDIFCRKKSPKQLFREISISLRKQKLYSLKLCNEMTSLYSSLMKSIQNKNIFETQRFSRKIVILEQRIQRNDKICEKLEELHDIVNESSVIASGTLSEVSKVMEKCFKEIKNENTDMFEYNKKRLDVIRNDTDENEEEEVVKKAEEIVVKAKAKISEQQDRIC
ncbi:hypothetical protein CWI38_1440p0010 [Hamiltosporidium tvaerminnensis]|uniref:Tubulin-specific chaperone A n=2 Tax=Hamiltosporidium TaxID=1176354 RepID=A0A4Q9LED8_9MICR|nr:hypothetical protein LUQ84_000014 [Hamiltosporidium tvaerminnensis]TBU03954.1 hypothetical protein CWI36_0835p0040 [Hamiltosporidium magnivora]TBU00718.1 hypothetical protein CWI37_0921p0010 [Hamiltosporidium tvaerminnensis]TBU06353.1 hypothetical protein CWI39_0510p0030 [Hamiltosporidium magnivora]TBU10946.1 hypothetical protein CWI38_1463p0010 [Hamiltosporidium tvaerminnensis]